MPSKDTVTKLYSEIVSPQVGDLGRDHNRQKHIYYACIKCGKPRWVAVVDDKPIHEMCKYCSNHSRKNSGVLNPHWNGGRMVGAGGYVFIKLSANDFFLPMAHSKSYVAEHRLVMAKHLGRLLHSWELVHHRNGLKTDNTIENLQLVSDDRHRQITLLESKIARQQEYIEKLEGDIRELRKTRGY